MKHVPARLKNAYDFFRANAGGIVGENARTALALAKAEEQAQQYGLVFVWEPDFVTPDDVNHDYWCKKDYCQHHIAVCICTDPETGEVLDSLGGIIDADQAYQRVIEAEMALNALDAIQEQTRTYLEKFVH